MGREEMDQQDSPIGPERTAMAEGPPQTMKAIVQDRYGLPDVLELREVPVPMPSDAEVLIEVKASSLNIYDWHMTTGTPYMARAVAGLARPKHPIPGADVAGVIVQLGSSVTEFKLGDEVFGDIGYGAFAEYAAASPSRIAVKPTTTTFEQAASVALAGSTALQGLRDVGQVVAGQRVIVNGASGGVGTFAVQIAKAFGAEVTAVCSTAKVEMVASIGADRVIDYTSRDYTETERDYDILFDNVGNRSWSETSRVLAPTGINVTITGPKHAVLGPFRNLLARKVASKFGRKRMTWFTAQVKPNDLTFLAGLLDAGRITPVIERTYPLAQLPAALAYVGEGHAHGKLVIAI